MLIEYITFTRDELNTQELIVKQVADKQLGSGSITLRYRPTSIAIQNLSGNTIFFMLMTEEEKNAFITAEENEEGSGNTISEFLLLLNGGEALYENFSSEVRYILIEGTAGHEQDVICEIVQDTNV